LKNPSAFPPPPTKKTVKGDPRRGVIRANKVLCSFELLLEGRVLGPLLAFVPYPFLDYGALEARAYFLNELKGFETIWT